MSSSFQSTGIVQTEKGISYLSEDSKKILENFHGFISTKYGLENVNYISVRSEDNGIYDSNYDFEDFNSVILTSFDGSNSRRFNESDIDIENDTITISDQIFSVGEQVSFLKEGTGNLPNGIIKDEKLYVKSLTVDGENYKFTFSKQKDGDKFDFTDQGSGGESLLAIRNPWITNFDANDIDLVNNTITISSLSTLEVGDRINFQTFGGSLPTGITSSDNFYIKSITQSGSNYNLTFSEKYLGDVYDFTSQGNLNYETASFWIEPQAFSFNLNYKFDKETSEWKITNYTDDGSNIFKLENLDSNPYLDDFNYYNNFYIDEVDGVSIAYSSDYGHSIELLGNTKATSSNKLNQNLLSLGIDLNDGTQYENYIFSQINTKNNGTVSVISDSTKYKFIINTDGNTPEIVQELDKTVGTASIDIEQLLEDKTGNLFYILTSNSDVDVDGVTHYKDDYSVVKISSDKTIETTSIGSQQSIKYGQPGYVQGRIGHYDYFLVPETDGDVWLVKQERVNGLDGTLKEAFKYNAWRFNSSNFDLDKPDIVLDSVLDMRNHYKTGEFLINSGGEEYNFDFSYTDDNDTHTRFLNSAQGIDNTINYAVAFDDSVSMSEYGSFAKTFSASKTVTWSITGGVDSDKFQVDSNTGSLSFKVKPDFENPNDTDLDNIYEVIVRATDAENIKIDRLNKVQVYDCAEKNSSGEYTFTYTNADGKLINPAITPSSGSFDGEISLKKLTNAPTTGESQSSNLAISQTGVDFKLKINETSDSFGSVITDIDALVDGLTTTNKNIAYFAYSDQEDGSSPNASTLTYDPIKKAGARFYDLEGDGSADKVLLELVDGGYGDKDGIKNGVIVDPSTAGVVDLSPKFTSSLNAITISDPTDKTSPAAFDLRVSISSKASTVNQIGYVALNANENDDLSYELIKNRGTIILSNLENSDTPSLTGMNLETDISIINNQKLIFFEVIDTTLDVLLTQNSSLDGFGTSFKILDISNATDSSANASKGGNTIAISLESEFLGVDDLIASDKGVNPILDFKRFLGLTLEGDVSVAREADFDSTVGFYKIKNANGAVTDPVTGSLITPGTEGYSVAALDSSNLYSSFGTLSTVDDSTVKNSISSFSDFEMLAPYASVSNTGKTYFAFADANADGLSHFREFGNGTIGLEDTYGGGDQDFDDLILGFDFKLSLDR